jgi:hypothetical protein
VVAVTRHEEFREETSRTFWSLEEEWEQLVARVHQLPRREALVRVYNCPTEHIVTAEVRVSDDESAVERFKQQTLETAVYARRADSVRREIRQRQDGMDEIANRKEEAGRPFTVSSFRE